MTAVQLGNAYFGGTNLTCLRYGDGYLHHGVVTVFDRHEDAEETRCARVAFDGVTVETVRSAGCGNPSSRRDGLTIAVECEGCGDGLTLLIAQHKGITQLRWQIEPSTRRDVTNGEIPNPAAGRSPA